jgi:hypothetical protein
MYDVTFSQTRGWVCVIWTGLAFHKCTYRHVVCSSSPGFEKQIMPVLLGRSWSWFTINGQSISRSVWLGVGLPSGAHDQIFVFSLMIKGFLDVRHPLWREDGSVIYLYNCFRTLPEQSLLGRSPAELTTIFSFHLRFPQPGGPGPRFYIPQEQGGSVIPLGTGFPFVASDDSRGYSGGILTWWLSSLFI